MNIEADIIFKFHRARIAVLAEELISDMQSTSAGGLFEEIPSIKNLWDEASWIISNDCDDVALGAASATIEQFACANAHQLLAEELVLHCYFLSDDTDENGNPYADANLVARSVAEHAMDCAKLRDFGEFSVEDDDYFDEEE
ncbi:MAG: hypothetical protein KGZ72_08240 [Roseovarius sp.]|jgi:hypothetical protein|nr:hypothetical protein [Roseovarius sp.]